MRLKKNLSREEELEQAARDFHDHNLTDQPSLNRTLFTAVEAMEECDIPYALIGGVAVKQLGRPRITHDIDLFVRPDDADLVLKILEERGFETEKRDPFWLFKAWREEVLVDVIFKSSGDIYFDEEVRANVRRVPYLGKYINAISPEDFIVIKAAAHQEHNPHHWHDALAVLTQGSLDWDYLVKRARHAPRRVLALLVYAQSNDVAIPQEVIQTLYRSLYEPQNYVTHAIHYPYRKDTLGKDQTEQTPDKEPIIYIKGKIMEALTTDERIAEHDIRVIVSESFAVAKGEVFTDEQRRAVTEVIRQVAPDLEVNNQVNVRVLSPPEQSEVIE
jgi:predicted nucleotidyltransferase